jgi:Flagellar basal body P-ring biosynthesis protein
MATRQRDSARTFRVDPRLPIGLALVLASVAGVYALVTSAQTSTEVYAARSTLAAGDVVHTEDLVTTHVRLGTAASRYLALDDLPEDGLVILRTVAEGELVPSSAVGGSREAELTSVVVTARGPLASSIGTGSAVDVWAADQTAHDTYGPPAVLVGNATVVRVDHDDALVGDRSTVSIEVRVPTAKTAAVLQAVGGGAAISVVPADLGARR